MSLINPDETGWTGLAYYYHLCIGWYDEDMWAVDDLVDAYNKFKSIPKEDLDSKGHFGKKSIEVLCELCQLFDEAISNNYKIFIQRD